MDAWKDRFYLHFEKENRFYLVFNRTYNTGVYFTTFHDGRDCCEYLNKLLNKKTHADLRNYYIKSVGRYNHFIMYNDMKICRLSLKRIAEEILEIIRKLEEEKI